MREKQCLITVSLVDSVNWFVTAPSSIIKPERGGDGHTTWAQKAEKDLRSTLAREKGDYTSWRVDGIQFENMIYDYAKRKEEDLPEMSGNLRIIVDEVRGMLFGQKSGVKRKIGDDECYLYARYDAVKIPVIKDIKTTSKYAFGKYLNGFQHKFYCYISGADVFKYVIVEWDDQEKDPGIQEVHFEQYSVTDRKELEAEVEDIIRRTLSELRELGLWDLYRGSYCLY